eukprot:8295979-Alexandrium_andersonii.AAC.1
MTLSKSSMKVVSWEPSTPLPWSLTLLSRRALALSFAAALLLAFASPRPLRREEGEGRSSASASPGAPASEGPASV